ncbi:hypothetical protein ACFWRK_35465, partial [Streptomyces cyaneofuscatus]
MSRSPEGWASVVPNWRLAPAPQPSGELIPPIQAAVNFSFTPIELDHTDPFGVTVVLMEKDGNRISLTVTFARGPHGPRLRRRGGGGPAAGAGGGRGRAPGGPGARGEGGGGWGPVP